MTRRSSGPQCDQEPFPTWGEPPRRVRRGPSGPATGHDTAATRRPPPLLRGLRECVRRDGEHCGSQPR
jgi:hypothetical protein